jgi:hypothetical protein
MIRPLLAIRGITFAVDLLETFRLSRPADQRAPGAWLRAVRRPVRPILAWCTDILLYPIGHIAPADRFR